MKHFLFTLAVLSLSQMSLADDFIPKVTVTAMNEAFRAVQKELMPQTRPCDDAQSEQPLEDEETTLPTPLIVEKEDKKVKIFFEHEQFISGQNGVNRSIPVRSMFINPSWALYSLPIQERENFYATASEERIEELLRYYGGLSVYGGAGIAPENLEDEVQVTKELIKMSLMDGTDEEIINTVAENTKDFSYDQKVRFLNNYLRSVNYGYDMDRTSGGANSGGEVSISEMNENMSTYFQNDPQHFAGVCRDMHQAAVKLAHAMGIKGAFGLSYATHGGWHMNMVLTDPSDRTKVNIFNYSGLYENDGVAGPTALTQEHTIPETGIGHLLWGHDDRPVLRLPSDKGAALYVISGGKDSDYHPLFDNPNTITKAGVEIGDVRLQAFNAKANMGNLEETQGISAEYKYGSASGVHGSVGTVLYTSSRDQVFGGPLSTKGVFLRADVGKDWQLLDLENYKLSSYAKGEFSGTIYFSHDPNENHPTTGAPYHSFNGEGYPSVTAGLKSSYGGETIYGNTQLETMISGWTSDATVTVSAPTLYMERTSLSSDLNFDMGRGTLVLDGGLHIHDLDEIVGLVGSGGVGVKSHDENFQVRAGIQGALTEETPFYLPGSERRLDGTMDARVGNINLGINGYKSLEVPGNHYFGFRVSGKFGGKKK